MQHERTVSFTVGEKLYLLLYNSNMISKITERRMCRSLVNVPMYIVSIFVKYQRILSSIINKNIFGLLLLLLCNKFNVNYKCELWIIKNWNFSGSSKGLKTDYKFLQCNCQLRNTYSNIYNNCIYIICMYYIMCEH